MLGHQLRSPPKRALIDTRQTASDEHVKMNLLEMNIKMNLLKQHFRLSCQSDKRGDWAVPAHIFIGHLHSECSFRTFLALQNEDLNAPLREHPETVKTSKTVSEQMQRKRFAEIEKRD